VNYREYGNEKAEDIEKTLNRLQEAFSVKRI